MTDKKRQDANRKLADKTLKLVIKRLNKEKRDKHVRGPQGPQGPQGLRGEPILSIFKWGRKK